MESLWKLLTKEHNVRFDEPATLRNNTVRDLCILNGLFHELLRKASMAMDAAMSRETPMGLYDEALGHTSFTFEAIDVLSE